MATDALLTADIRTIFSEEVTALGGVVSEAVEVGPALFARSIMEWVEEVRAGDRVQGGVALRSNARTVFVHPYVFRQVCKNGCIVASVVGTEQVELREVGSADAIRQAIRGCGNRECFSGIAERMRTSRESQADLVVTLLPMLTRWHGDGRSDSIFGEIMRRYLGDEDSSTYGLMNAVTSVARDTPEPRLRWRLEEFGGGLLVASPRSPRLDGSRARSLLAV